MVPWLLAGALALFVAPQDSLPQQASVVIDVDRDGVDDTLEAALLERFRPVFMVGSGDCDQLPAEFAAADPEAGALPHAIARNGTIYGQVFRRGSDAGAALAEIHYYHLWARDCGKRGHDFDAEHVAVLIAAPGIAAPAPEWTARTWYAAAHEDTVCDVSGYVPATRLGATGSGATVWISKGKHASYLSREGCHAGCGGDRCESMVAIPTSMVVNVGEPGAPINGAGWTASASWPLQQKMRTDFPDALLAAGAVPPPQPMSQRAMRGVVGRSASVEQHTGDALGTAGEHAGRGVGVGKTKTGNSLKRALGATGRFLGVVPKEKEKSGPDR